MNNTCIYRKVHKDLKKILQQDAHNNFVILRIHKTYLHSWLDLTELR